MKRRKRIGSPLLSAASIMGPLSGSTLAAGNTWSKEAPLSSARDGFGAVGLSNGLVYVIGGGNQSGALRTIQVYHPSTNTWTNASPLLTAQADLAIAAGKGGLIYAIGGSTNGPGPINTVEA